MDVNTRCEQGLSALLNVFVTLYATTVLLEHAIGLHDVQYFVSGYVVYFLSV